MSLVYFFYIGGDLRKTLVCHALKIGQDIVMTPPDVIGHQVSVLMKHLLERVAVKKVYYGHAIIQFALLYH